MTTVLLSVLAVIGILLLACILGVGIVLIKDVMELNQFYYIPSDSKDVSIVDVVKKHEKLIQQLYLDRDEDVNKFADEIDSLNERIKTLKNDVSLVDMVKDLQERCDTLYEMMVDRIMDINELRYSINAAKADRRNSEYKITVGDDPNQMQTGTTVQGTNYEQTDN